MNVLIFCATYFLGAFAAVSAETDSSSGTMDVDLIIAPSLAMKLSKEWFKLDTTPTIYGDFVHDTTTIYIDTNDRSGYTLTMSSKTDETSLINETDSSQSIKNLGNEASITQSDQANFALNSWGYSLDTNFTNGVKSSVFKPIPVPSSAQIINSSADSIKNSMTDVTIATRAGMSLIPGVYKNNLVFTATTNYVEPISE